MKSFIRSYSLVVLVVASTGLCMTGARAAEPGTTGMPTAWTFAAEADILPYATGGYYGSFIAGHQAWRVRAVAARANVPGFMLKEGFADKRTDAYAILADRFVGPKRVQHEGFWIGGGAEIWRNRIRQEGGDTYAKYSNLMLTAGGGYLWRFSPRFYLNPWSGVHFAAGGKREIDVAGRTYQQPRVVPEASVKIGFIF